MKVNVLAEEKGIKHEECAEMPDLDYTKPAKPKQDVPYSFQQRHEFISVLGNPENPLPPKLVNPLDNEKSDEPSFMLRL